MRIFPVVLFACSGPGTSFAPRGELFFFEEGALAVLEWGIVDDLKVKNGDLYGGDAYAPCAVSTFEGWEGDTGCDTCARSFRLELQSLENNCDSVLSPLLETNDIAMGLGSGEKPAWLVLEEQGWETWGHATPAEGSDEAWVLESAYSMAH